MAQSESPRTISSQWVSINPDNYVITSIGIVCIYIHLWIQQVDKCLTCSHNIVNSIYIYVDSCLDKFCVCLLVFSHIWLLSKYCVSFLLLLLFFKTPIPGCVSVIVFSVGWEDHILQNKTRVWQNTDLRTVFPNLFCYIYKVFRCIMEKYLLVHYIRLTVIILCWKKYHTDILLAMRSLFGVHFVSDFFIKHFYSDYSDLLVWISLYGCVGML